MEVFLHVRCIPQQNSQWQFWASVFEVAWTTSNYVSSCSQRTWWQPHAVHVQCHRSSLHATGKIHLLSASQLLKPPLTCTQSLPHLGNHGRLGRDVNRFKSYLSTICLTRPNAQQIPSLFDAGHWTQSGTALMDVPFCWLLVAKCEIFLVLHKMLLKSCRFIRIKGSYMRGKLKRNIWLHDLTPPQQRTSHKQPHCRKWSLHVLRPFLQAGRTNLPIMNSKGYCARGLGCKLEVKSQEPCMCVYI